ncbi:hypothetical protein KEM54_004624 [Ascosphaera aggregata]|nr:hypothetical protein KEM54_004624 [Ascosphaera aggregata]
MTAQLLEISCDRAYGDRVHLQPTSSYSIHISAQGPSVSSGSPRSTMEVLDKYPAKQHARNVASRLLDSNGLIYLKGQMTRLREDSDMEVQFNQRRYFAYMSGVIEPDCALLYHIESGSLSSSLHRY